MSLWDIAQREAEEEQERLENKIRALPEKDRSLYAITYQRDAEGVWRPSLRLKSELLMEDGTPAFP